jgi:hypothetical protein
MAGSAGAAPCNTLDFSAAPSVTPQKVAQAAPAPSGGSISPGVYYQTSETIYTGNGGPTGAESTSFKLVIVITGNTIEQAAGTSTQSDRRTMTFTAAPPYLSVTRTCGQSQGQTENAGYTVTGNQLTVYTQNNDGLIEEHVYVKQ